MRLIALVTVAAIGAVVLSGCTTSSDGPLQVLGYVHDKAASTAVIESAADSIDRVGIDGVLLREDGHGIQSPPEHGTRLVAAAHAKGLKADLLVSNYSEELHDFDPRIAARMLDDAGSRDAVIEALKAVVDDGGYDGLQLDLESMSADDADGFVTFVQELKAELGPEKSLSTTVMASVEPEGYAAAGYNLVALDAAIDRFTLMAYDQHGPSFSEPGPVGGLPWTTSCLEALLSTGVEAAKVDLGVAGYGYEWPADGSAPPGLSVAAARTMAGDLARFNEDRGEWSARLDDGTVLWWSDNRSIALKRELATARGLHGIAIWDLELAGPLEATVR